MRWVIANELFHLGQTIRQRRPFCAAVAEEAETCSVERLDFRPLLRVFGRRRLERSPHLIHFAAAVGTRCRQVRSRCDLKTLAAIEAGVSDQVLGAWHVLDLQASPALRL